MSEAFLNGLFALDGRVALVTGASGGIGAAVAAGLAAAGASVALSGRSPERLERARQAVAEAGGRAAVFPADLGVEGAPQALAGAVAAAMGGIDILVNCAGMNRRQPIGEVSPAVYDEIMAANLRSAFFLSQAALPHMVARGGGKVVNIGSLTVATGLLGVSVYGMTKSALAQLTKTMAVEWAEHNIQANCLSPGFIETELTGPLWANPARREWMLSRIPSKRPGKPADMVGTAVFLASPASDYLTGQTIFVDGGFTAGSQW
jgi:NAD(P)-dependent dehydrogenase (short-subunit alcohol dehydrogenase family)